MLNYITEQPLTEPLVEEFLQAELKAGASPNSVKRYRGDLVQLRRFLGEDAVVRRGTLQAWMQSMQQAGYAPRTVCARIDTANRFLYQLGVPELCQQPPRCAIQPTLAMTKEEYAALLETAKSQKCDRIALLLRLFAETAMPVQGVEAVTVEAVQADMVVVKLPRAYGRVQLSPQLRSDLLTFARQQGIRTGLIINSRNGRPLTRSNVTLELQRMAARVGLSPEKASPRCLQKLCPEANRPVVLDEAAVKALQSAAPTLQKGVKAAPHVAAVPAVSQAADVSA